MQLIPATLEAINKGFNRRFQDALAKVQPQYGRIASLMPSTSEEEIYGWLDQISGLREWIGERQIENISARSYSLKNKDFEKTIGVEKNKIEDDKLSIYGPRLDALAHQAAMWPDDLVRDALQAGVTTECFDGQYFFDTDHPIDLDDPASASQSNNFTGTALTAANYATVRAAMMAYKGKDGRPLGIVPNLLVVPPQLEKTAREILNAEIVANAAGTASVSNVYQNSAELFVWSRLANEATTWYLLDTTKGINPFIFQQRKAPQFTYVTDPTAENVFMRKEFLYGVDCRGVAGYSLPVLAARAIA